MKWFGRIITVALVALTAGGHWFVGALGTELAAPETEAQQVSVAPLPLTVFCSGAFVEVAGASGVDLGEVNRIGEARIYGYTSSPDLIQAAPELSSIGVKAVARETEQSTNLLSLLQVQSIDRERARGLAGSYCSKPSVSGWLINGSSVVGAESVLIAGNPSAVEALVEIEIHLPGRVVTDRFALAPDEEKLIPTASYANGEEVFAVFYQSAGPAISVAMQNRETRGLTPTGIELENPVSGPSTEFVFAGLRPLDLGFDNPVMRIYNPGIAVSEVVVTAFGAENVELFRASVNPGDFGEIELILTGEYQLVTMSSSEPVIAGIKNPSLEPILDFAWLMPADLFTEVSVPLAGSGNTLVVANPLSVSLEARLEVRNGDVSSFQNIVVPAFQQRAIAVSGTSVTVVGTAEFAVALEVLRDSGYTVIHPSESKNLGNDLEIFVR